MKNSQQQNINNRPINVDILTLNPMQKKAYEIVKTHFEDNSQDKDPLLLIILGVAGTGKSYLISAIKQLLQQQCALAAPTDKVSCNMKGVTLHSLLKLPVGQVRRKDLTGQSLAELQANMEGVNYIIIDEYSMLGQLSFGWVDRRCRKATGAKDQILEGKSMILIGDPCQLPPVGDKVLYHHCPSTDIAQNGYDIYNLFDKVVCLTSNQRVAGSNRSHQMLRELLLRLRAAECMKDDWQILPSRQPSVVHNLHEFKNATRLFYTKADVAKYSNDK